MRKFITAILGLVLITSPSCNTSTESESTTRRELTQAEKNGMNRIKNRSQAKKDIDNMSENNLLSPYRYLISSDEYPIFTFLLKQAKLSKHIHSAGVTVLAPKDGAFDAHPDYKKLLEPGNEELLESFIAHHVIDNGLMYKEFSEEGRWTVHSGDSYILDNRGGITFNGAHVRTGTVSTKNGTIIGLDDLVFFPELK